MKTIHWFAAAFLAAGAFGQIEAGEALPPVTLTLVDGTALRAGLEGGALTVRRGGEIRHPRALMVHFLQPDCLQCQAQLKAMQEVSGSVGPDGGAIVGAAHRGDLDAVRAVVSKLGLTFPVGLLDSKAGLEKAVGGDACAIADRTGTVRFAQAGFGEGDQALWREVFEAMLAGRPSPHATVARERLKAGDNFPAIALPSLRTGRPMEYASIDGKIRFTDEDGKQTSPKGAIFFFSRYWAFAREEMVHLQKFHEARAKDGLLVFAIAMHPDKTKAQELSRELGLTYPIFDGMGSALGKLYAYGWPAYIVDAGGVIRHTQVGFEAGDEKKYAAAIAKILSGDDGCALPPAPAGPESRRETGAVRVPWWTGAPRPQRMLFHAGSSTDAPHRAVLPLRFAVAAKEKGHDAVVFLAGDATMLMKDEVAASTKAAGQPDAATLIKRCAELGVPIFLWGGWAKARGVLVQDLEGKNAVMIDPATLVDLVAGADKVMGLWAGGYWRAFSKGLQEIVWVQRVDLPGPSSVGWVFFTTVSTAAHGEESCTEDRCRPMR